MGKLRECIVFYIYQRREVTYQMIGRLVYNNFQLAPLKREVWTSIKVNALNLSDSFTGKVEFLKRIQAVERERDPHKGFVTQ
jgi:hypothetical protein